MCIVSKLLIEIMAINFRPIFYPHQYLNNSGQFLSKNCIFDHCSNRSYEKGTDLFLILIFKYNPDRNN